MGAQVRHIYFNLYTTLNMFILKKRHGIMESIPMSYTLILIVYCIHRFLHIYFTNCIIFPQDPIHTGVLQIVSQPITSRPHSYWSMAYCVIVYSLKATFTLEYCTLYHSLILSRPHSQCRHERFIIVFLLKIHIHKSITNIYIASLKIHTLFWPK